MPAQVRVSGVWRKTLASVRVAGAWRSTPQIYAKAGGVWRALYSYSWSLGGWGGCSASCGGGTQTRSVTCVRNDGVVMPDAVCAKLVGAKPATSQACNTPSCVGSNCCCDRSRQQFRYYTNKLPCTTANVGHPWPNMSFLEKMGCYVANISRPSCTGGFGYWLGNIYGITGEQTPGLGSNVLVDNSGVRWNCVAIYYWVWGDTSSNCGQLCAGKRCSEMGIN